MLLDFYQLSSVIRRLLCPPPLKPLLWPLKELKIFRRERKKRFPDLLLINDIVLSSQLELKPLAEPSGLTRTPITWPLQDLNMFYVLEAPPCTDVPKHAHQSDIFRLVIEVELEIQR